MRCIETFVSIITKFICKWLIETWDVLKPVTVGSYPLVLVD